MNKIFAIIFLLLSMGLPSLASAEYCEELLQGSACFSADHPSYSVCYFADQRATGACERQGGTATAPKTIFEGYVPGPFDTKQYCCTVQVGCRFQCGE